MEKEFKPYSDTCQCHKIPGFLHELNQSLLVIHAYINGCRERLKENTLDNKQLIDVFSAISKQTDIIDENIDYLNFTNFLSFGK